MTLLEDRSLKNAIESGRISITPYDPSLVQPNSLDVRIGNTESQYVATGYTNIINLANDAPRSVSRQVDEVIIRPGEFKLVDTMEYFKLPSDVFGMVVGKSSTGRLGIDVENAGLIDSGFEGTITLELYNKQKSIGYKIPPGFAIAQIVFFECREVEEPYCDRKTARYCGQRGATPYRKQVYDTDVGTASSEADGTDSTIGKVIDHFSPRKRRKRSGGDSGSSTDSGE